MMLSSFIMWLNIALVATLPLIIIIDNAVKDGKKKARYMNRLIGFQISLFLFMVVGLAVGNAFSLFLAALMVWL